MDIRNMAAVALVMTCIAATPATAAPAKAKTYAGVGSFSSSEVLIPDATNRYEATITDAVEGARSGEDRLSIAQGTGLFTFRHEAIPGGEAACHMNGYAIFGSSSRTQGWVEQLRESGSVVGDAAIYCYPSDTNAGKDWEVYILRYATADDPAGECLTLSKNDDGSYSLVADRFTPERTETKTTDGLPVIGGGGEEEVTYPATGCRATLWHSTEWPGGNKTWEDVATVVADDVSAGFTYTFTASL